MEFKSTKALKKIKQLNKEKQKHSKIVCENDSFNDSSGQVENSLVNISKIDKEILLIQKLLPKDLAVVSNSKTIETIIQSSAEEEKHTISKYLIEKFSQATIEGVQDFFKDIIKEQQEQTEKMKEWIKESLIRSREYQRWSEHEIHSLIYMWKVEFKDPANIARLMQRSVGSIEKMIDFVESDKYLNSENFFKNVKTKVESEENERT